MECQEHVPHSLLAVKQTGLHFSVSLPARSFTCLPWPSRSKERCYTCEGLAAAGEVPLLAAAHTVMLHPAQSGTLSRLQISLSLRYGVDVVYRH